MVMVFSPQMQQQWLLLATLAISWLVSCQALITDPLLALGALTVLKGAAIAGYAFGSVKSGGRNGGYRPRPYHRHQRWGRAAGSDPRQVEDVLPIVTQLDPDGCLLKLLCLAKATPTSTRTPYQLSLMNLFASITQAPKPASIPFVQALQAGSGKGKPEAACCASYSSCPLSEATLHSMLVQVWDASDQQQNTSTSKNTF